MNVRQRFLDRIEQLKGSALRAQDLSFMQAEIPISELELLKSFSQINSATLMKPGIALMQDQVSARLEALGFKIQKFAQDPRFGDLVLAERPGAHPGFITLVGHVDTVLGNDQTFTIDLPQGKAFGSGVIDDKGGLIVGLTALQRLLQRFPQTQYGLRFICSPNEEMGSIGFIELLRGWAADTLVGFGLEPALDNGSIVHQRRGNRWYEIHVAGRSAHAGRSYGEHANAAHDLATKIVALAKLTNNPKHMSVNVGHIEGGKDLYNIICGDALAKLDVRFATLESREQLHRKIAKILATPGEVSPSGLYQCTTTYKIVDDCPPFSLTRRSKGIARSYAALVSQLEGRKVASQPAGGAGDVNYLSTATNIILDGLGPVGGEMHTSSEFVNIASLRTRAQALAGFLMHLQTLKF